MWEVYAGFSGPIHTATASWHRFTGESVEIGIFAIESRLSQCALPPMQM